MPVLRIQSFSGEVPITGDRALPEGFATEAFNTYLYGHELRGVRPPELLEVIQTTTKKVFRVPKRTVGGNPATPGVVPPPSYLGDSVWMQFTDPDTDIVRGQLVEDSYERWYFCSPSTGLRFNTYARMVAGQPAYILGVPGPSVVIDGAGNNADKPTVTSITGGTAPTVTRAYVYTWANQYGEESSPSLPVVATGNANGTWNIDNIKDPPSLGSSYPTYTKKYLYRTITGASGQTTYYRVNSVAFGTSTFADNGAVMTDAVLANSLTLQSTHWAPPPSNLEGIIAMPNGFLIGFAGSDLYFSEAYHFHAWPAEYKQASEYPVVGLGILAQTCVVCTEGFPATITGSTPATCSFTKATTGEPCLSRGSIVSSPQGVIYASQNGLTLVGPEGIANITEKLITRDEWVHDYDPQYMRATRYQNGYLASSIVPGVTERKCFMLDPTELRVALTQFTDCDDAVNFMADYWSGEVFIIEPGEIIHWDAASHEMMPVIWKSKEFQYPYPENFGAYAIYWDDARYSDVGSGLTVMPTDEKVRFKVYANRTLIYDEEVPRNGRPIRLPSGFKSDVWQFEIRARAPIYSLHVASTVKELRQV